MKKPGNRPISVLLLLILLFFQAVSGLYGGGTLILDPTGDLLQLPLTLLGGAPFQDFLIPGIILFAVLGVFPLVVFFGMWRRKRWSWPAAVFIGSALTIWIGVQIAMIGYTPEPPLQLIYGLVGILLLFLTQVPAVRSFLITKALHHESKS